MKNKVLKWELIGIALISVLGSLFHFVFEWTGGLAPVGFFTPVNESVFEHLKLTLWPTVLYAIISFKWLKPISNNFLAAKAASVYIMPLIIIIIFYCYTAFTGESIVVVDILTFFIAVAGGQFVSYKILNLNSFPKWLNWLSVAFIIALALVYGLLTFFPPHLPIFMDGNTSVYGIP
jgi:hypothetical protein